MQKIYERINWENEPSTNTAVCEDNLNKMDYAIDKLDDRVINLAGYEERAKQSEENALEYANSASESEANALKYANNSSASANAAKKSEDNTLEYKNAASTSANNAEKSNLASKQNAEDAKASAEQADKSEANAFLYAESAKNDAAQINGRIDNAESAAQSAEQSSQNASAKSSIADEKAALAEQYAIMAESFLHGGTGVRENEAYDNSEYFLEQMRQMSQSKNGYLPMGTITFAELSLEINQVANYTFDISDDFITDETFKGGAGVEFPAGTNVYRTNNGYWDCLAGSFLTRKGDTKDNVTAFVPASTRANIQSSEKHSIIFGKIAKWFTDLKTVAFTGSYKDLSDKPSARDVGAVATGGDIAENTVAYTEATDLAELTSGEKVSIAFAKMKLAVKNVITIANLLGNTDISKIGDGTVTGILSTLNSELSDISKWVFITEFTTDGIHTLGINLDNYTSMQLVGIFNGYVVSSLEVSIGIAKTYILSDPRYNGSILRNYNIDVSDTQITLSNLQNLSHLRVYVRV